jgi:hypothetical protein
VATRQHVSESFVARIWLEHGSNGEPIWRGHIQHVQGREQTYFQDLWKLREFVERVSGIPGPAIEPTAERAKGRGN